jgi:2-polyprenyl-3-methyl-5-hydroxy-6-metoxy-1,4-benzoquinol methylase
VILDPTNQYIATILSQCDLSGKDVLEIGCGKGRITRDLAKHAKRVTATDPDAAAIETARVAISADNVEFMHTPTGLPETSAGPFDLAIYTLSLHHVPADRMLASLSATTNLLNKDGIIIVVEPGTNGSFIDAEERFGVGCGNERTNKATAILAMHSLQGWTVGQTILFRTMFLFDNDDDFFCNLLPGYRQKSASSLNEMKQFLDPHRIGAGILLDGERRLNVLRKV